MAFTFQELVAQFLTTRRAYEFETVEFVTRRHDADLVPNLDRLLAHIASSYGYFTALSYETQGINDNGSDVTVRYRELGTESDDPPRVLGFQVKSHIELTEKSAMSVIKAQRDDAFRKIPGLTHYYIVLCADEGPLRKRLNAIRAEFANVDRTTVISPVQALRFYRYEAFQIDGQVKRLVDDKDVVLREFQKVLAGIGSDSAKALLCFLAVNLLVRGTPQLRVREILQGPLGSVYRKLIDAAIAQEERLEKLRETANKLYELEGEVFDDDGEDEDPETLAIPSFDPANALAFDIEHLEGTFLEHSHDGEHVSLLVPAIAPVVAVAAEALVRYEYPENELVPYLLDIAGVDI